MNIGKKINTEVWKGADHMHSQVSKHVDQTIAYPIVASVINNVQFRDVNQVVDFTYDVILDVMEKSMNTEVWR